MQQSTVTIVCNKNMCLVWSGDGGGRVYYDGWGSNVVSGIYTLLVIAQGPIRSEFTPRV